MERRQFIRLLGGTAAWPLAAHAQQTGNRSHSYAAAFEQALPGLGWHPGLNIELDYRWTEDDFDIARATAAALVAAKPDVIFAANTRSLTIFAQPQNVDAGGLMSYGNETVESYRGAAVYVDRILKGAKPGDLPDQFASKFKPRINLKIVQTLGLELPMSMMLTADEVIE